MSHSSEAISLQYRIDDAKEGLGAFNHLIKSFTETFLWAGRGGILKHAYSQKVEKRKLGIMAGFHGVLRWSGGEESSSDELFEFLLLDRKERRDEHFGVGTFAIQESISVHLVWLKKKIAGN